MHKRFFTLKSKLILSYVIIIPISFAIFMIIITTITSKAMETQSNSYSTLFLESYSQQFKQTINEIDRITRVSLINQNLLDVLASNGNITDSNNYAMMQNYMFQIMTLRTDIDKIYLTDLKGHNYTFGYNNYISMDYDMTKEKWYKIFEKSSDLFMIVPPYYNNSMYNYSVISVARKIKDPLSSKINGIIKIDIRTDFFNDIDSVNSIEGASTIILDQFNIPIHSSNSALDNINIKPIIKNINGQSGHFATKINNKKYVINYKKSSYTHFTLLLIIPQKIFLNKVSNISDNIILIGFFCVVLGIIFSIKFSHSISKSIESLSRGMKKVEKGDFTVKIPIYTNDEIGYLSKSFNTMINRVNILVKANSIAKAKEAQAEVKLLTSQINPHFIYNTLEVIRMKAITNQSEDASNIIEELGEFLRYSLNRKEEFAFLDIEIQYIKKYIALCNMRFKEKIKLFINIDPFLYKIKLPRLILQPIVENSIVHGLEPKRNNREITILAETYEDYILIKIIDNGNSPDDNTIKCLNESFESNKSDYNNRIGMSNVNNRLKLYYGDDCGLTINVLNNAGTQVTIKLKSLPKIIKFDN